MGLYQPQKSGYMYTIKSIFLVITMLALPVATLAQDNSCSRFLPEVGSGSSVKPDGGWCYYVKTVVERGEQPDAFSNCMCTEEKSKLAKNQSNQEINSNTDSTFDSKRGSYEDEFSEADGFNSANNLLESSTVGDDPYLSSQRQQIEASRRQMADFRRQMEEQNIRKEQLSEAAGATMKEWSQGNFIEGSESLATEFARQGNAGAAYGTVALGVIAEISSMFKKDREEERRQEQAVAEQRRQEELYRQRQEQLERELLRMQIEQRHLILDTFSNNTSIPLASSKVGTDRIFYFVYGIDQSTIDQRSTVVYVSNVFEIAKYNDGTWPYQSQINEELNLLIPFTPILNGYYTSLEEAELMRNEFVISFNNNEGVAVKEFEYNGKPASRTRSATLGNPLGVSIDGLRDTSSSDSNGNNGLGISIPAKKKKSNNQ